MKISNQFTVAAPLETTWKTLLDLERVAGCLPGAKVRRDDADGTYRGQMKVKLGAVTAEYEGVAEVREIDEDAHMAVFDVSGKEKRGQGTASAAITNRLDGNDQTTTVTVETDLNITGRPAQFGRGLMEDVAASMLGEFAKRLEREILDPSPADSVPSTTVSGDGPGAEPTGVATEPKGTAERKHAAIPEDDEEVFDLGAAAWLPVAKRAVPLAALAALGLLLIAAFSARRRRSITLHINL